MWSMWNHPIVLSRLSLMVSSSAFLFQTNVLYPWHKEISHDLHQLRNHIESSISSKQM